MKKFLNLVLIGIVLSIATQSFAGEINLLVDKLVEKDVISPLEAQILLDETKAAVAKEIAEVKSDTLPAWVQKFKLKGDLRLRYQSEEKDTITSSSTTNSKRERSRIRFRLGLEGKVTDGWKVNAGLATGSDDPRSTNQTMQDNFSSKGINLDYAYATHTPANWLTVQAGKTKIKNSIWVPGDLLWDGDINPEGAVVQTAIPGTDIWFNSAYFLIDEVRNGAEPTMFIAQPGITKTFGDFKAKASVNYYRTNALKGFDTGSIVDGAGTNSTDASSGFKYDYDCLGFSGELAKKNFIPDVLKYGAVFFDYIQNPDPNDENTGYMVGIKFGDKKVKKSGKWQAKVLYRELEKDAWLDFLPDSDFLGGDTNAKGYELILKYAIAKNVVLGLDYYSTETLKTSGTKEEQDLLQIDCVMKF